MRNRLFSIFAGAIVALAISSAAAFAQVACSIASEAPVDSALTAYTISASDGCKFLNFTSAAAVTVTVPAPATTVPSGFKVFIKAQEGTVTLSAASGVPIDNRMGTIAVTIGTGGYLYSNNTKWYWSGLGIKHP